MTDISLKRVYKYKQNEKRFEKKKKICDKSIQINHK